MPYCKNICDFTGLQIGGSAIVFIFVNYDIRVYNFENIFKFGNVVNYDS
jgi:hypothetical protein